MKGDGNHPKRPLRSVDPNVRELSFGLSGAVQAYIDQHTGELLRRAAAWDAQSNREETLAYIQSLREDWATIPIQEKQTPYAPLERHFWAIFTMLLLCATGRDKLAPDRKLPDDYDDRMAVRLQELALCMREGRALPANVVARRHQP